MPDLGHGKVIVFTKDVQATTTDIDNIKIQANTISSTDTNGNILLIPDGTGAIGNISDLTDRNFRIQYSGIESLDQSNLSTTENASGFTWQSFTSATTGRLSKISLEKTNPDAISATIFIREGTGVGGTILASEAVATSVSGFFDVIFSSPAEISSTQTYTIQYSGTNVVFKRNPGNPYAGGQANWAANYDAGFKTFVTQNFVDLGIRTDTGSFTINIDGAPTELLEIGGNVNLLENNSYKINGTTLIQESQIDIDNLTLDESTISSSDDIILSPAASSGIGNTSLLTNHLFKILKPGTESLDQSSLTSNEPTSGFTWQSFTAGASGFLTKVSLEKASAASTTATISIYQGEGTGGTLLTSEPLSTSASGLIDILFSSPASVTSGQVYTIGYSGTNVTFRRDTTDPYASGRSNWSATIDAVFRTYVTTGLLDFAIRRDTETISINVSNPTEKFEVGGNIKATGSGIFESVVIGVDTTDVSNPPTLAELDATFGTPATVGAGFTKYIDDNGAGANFYQVVSDGTNWWISTFTKAV